MRSIVSRGWVAGLATLLLFSHTSLADLVTFDELDATASDVALAGLNPYHALTWSNFYAYTALEGFDGFNQGITSGANAAYSGGEVAGDSVTPLVGSVSSAALFDFQQASVGAGWYDNLSLMVQGSRAGQVLYSQTLNLTTQSAQLFNFNFSGIDTVTFVAMATASTVDPMLCGSFNCTQFSIDDFLFGFSTQTEPGTIPEPGPLMLALAGLFGWLPALRRRQGIRRSTPLAVPEPALS